MSLYLLLTLRQDVGSLELRVFLMGFLFPLDYLIESFALKFVQKKQFSELLISPIHLDVMEAFYRKIF